MNEFQSQSQWKDKWQLATSGDLAAQSSIKTRLNSPDNLLLNSPFNNLVKQSRFIVLPKGQIHGPYELYSRVPVYLLLEGRAQMQCINVEGDNETVAVLEGPGVLQLQQSALKAQLGQNNLTLVTQFELIAVESCVVVELSLQAVAAVCAKKDETEVTLRQQIIMRKYMLISLKHITKMTWGRGMTVSAKFYLLSGRACYYSTKLKCMLCCYEQGYFNPSQFDVSSDFKLYLFEGARLLIFQEEMMKDDVASGAEIKREQHLLAVRQRYQKMGSEERGLTQEKLIAKYALNKQETEKEILGVVRVVERAVEKRAKSKNDFIQTSSSINKQKCGIRIRKSRKVA